MAKQELVEQIRELEYLFKLRYKADMRAIAMWRKRSPDRELRLPDHTDLVCFLLEQLDAFEAKLLEEIIEHLPDELKKQASGNEEVEDSDMEKAKMCIKEKLVVMVCKITNRECEHRQDFCWLEYTDDECHRCWVEQIIDIGADWIKSHPLIEPDEDSISRFGPYYMIKRKELEEAK